MANPPVDAALLLMRVTIGVTMIVARFNHWRGGGKIADCALVRGSACVTGRSSLDERGHRG